MLMLARIPAHRVVGPFHFLPTFILAHYPLLLNQLGAAPGGVAYRQSFGPHPCRRRRGTGTLCPRAGVVVDTPSRAGGGTKGVKDVAEASRVRGGVVGRGSVAWLRRCGVWFGTGRGEARMGVGVRGGGGAWGAVLAAVLSAVPAWSWAQLDEAELGKQVVTLRVYKGGMWRGTGRAWWSTTRATC